MYGRIRVKETTVASVCSLTASDVDQVDSQCSEEWKMHGNICSVFSSGDLSHESSERYDSCITQQLEDLSKLTHLSEVEKQSLLEILTEHHDVFLLQGDSLGYCDQYAHKIETGEASPIKQAARRLPFHRRAALKALLNDLMQKGPYP